MIALSNLRKAIDRGKAIRHSRPWKKSQTKILIALLLLTIFTFISMPATAMAAGSPGRLLERTHEACSNYNLWVRSMNGYVHIPYATAKWVNTNTGSIRWYCGNSRERTGCPAGTDWAYFSRSTGRRFTVYCYS